MTNRQSVRHRQAHRPCYIANNRLHLLLCMYYQTCWTALGPECEYPLGHSIHSSMFYTLHTHPINDPFPGLPRWAGTRKVKPICILLKQETVSGSGISRAIWKSAPCSWQTTTPAPHHSVFYRPDAFPAAQPTASKHWRQCNAAANVKCWFSSVGSWQTLQGLSEYITHRHKCITHCTPAAIRLSRHSPAINSQRLNGE